MERKSKELNKQVIISPSTWVAVLMSWCIRVRMGMSFSFISTGVVRPENGTIDPFTPYFSHPSPPTTNLPPPCTMLAIFSHTPAAKVQEC